MGVKFIAKIGLLLLVVFLVGKFLGLKVIEADSQNPVLKFRDAEGNFKIEVREPEKTQLKELTRQIKGLIYKEATQHNPTGDMLPDQIDDRIIQEVKDRVN